MSDLVGDRRCIRCNNPIRPTAKATENLRDVKCVGSLVAVAQYYGYCSDDCLYEYALHKIFLGQAWWQK